MSDELLKRADAYIDDNNRGDYISIMDLVELVTDLAQRVRELEAERDALRCPNCDKLRLELGAPRAENAALRAAMVHVRAHTGTLPNATLELTLGLLASIERIADAALAQGEKPNG